MVESDYKKAFALYSELLKNGKADDEVYRRLGDCYFEGLGTECDKAYAVSLYEKVQDKDAPLLKRLSLAYYYGDGVEQDHFKAVGYLRPLAFDYGDADAQFKLGECYMFGLGVERDRREAMRYYKMSALQDNPDALFAYAWCCYVGLGGSRWQMLAALKQAARLGHKTALYDLGVCYYKGFLVEADQRMAAEYFQRAAIAGHAEAQYNLGLMYFKGHGVKKDKQVAAKWLSQSAANGFRPAKTKLKGVINADAREQAQERFKDGMSLLRGEGQEQNFSRAAACFRSALECDKNNHEALFYLGLCLMQGADANIKEAISCFSKHYEQKHEIRALYMQGLCYFKLRNYEKALPYFEQTFSRDKKAGLNSYAALAGSFAELQPWKNKTVRCADAALKIGECYLNGYGVSQDLEKAKYYLAFAADLGNRDATFLLIEMDEKSGPSQGEPNS